MVKSWDLLVIIHIHKKGGLCHLAPVIQNSVGFISCSNGEIVKVDVWTKQILGTVTLGDSGCMN